MMTITMTMSEYEIALRDARKEGFEIVYNLRNSIEYCVQDLAYENPEWKKLVRDKLYRILGRLDENERTKMWKRSLSEPKSSEGKNVEIEDEKVQRTEIKRIIESFVLDVHHSDSVQIPSNLYFRYKDLFERILKNGLEEDVQFLMPIVSKSKEELKKEYPNEP